MTGLPPRFWKIRRLDCSRSERFHARDEAEVRAAGAALSGSTDQGFLGSSTAIVLAWAIMFHARAILHRYALGHCLVACDLFLNGFSHATFAALGRTWGVNFLCYGVIAAGLHLLGHGAVTGILITQATEHRAAGREAEGYGDQGGEKNKVFHWVLDWLI